VVQLSGLASTATARRAARGFPLQLEPVGVVDEAVEDGVAEGGIRNPIVPGRYRDLAGDDGGGTPMAVIDDLQQVAPLLGGERGQPQSSRISSCTRARPLSMRA